MLKEDLTTPLERRTIKDRLGLSALTPLRVATCSVLATSLALFGWLGLNNDPLGGEPIVTIELLPSDPVVIASASRDAGTVKEVAEASSDSPEKGSVRVFDANGKSIDIPSAPKTITIGSRPGSPHIEGALELSSLDRQFDMPLNEVFEEPDFHTGAIGKALQVAPIRKLVEQTKFGPLPKISGNLTPAKAYARPVNREQVKQLRGRIAIVIGGMGLSEKSTLNGIRRLPSPVTLAFAPYGKDLQRWIAKARGRGHEVLLQLPMEPFNYPVSSPGPEPLLTSLHPAGNIERLKKFMGRFTGYTGVTNYMGAKFTSDASALGPVMAELKRRGLTYLDDGASARSKALGIGRQFDLGVVSADAIIDRSHNPERIRAALEQLEKIALKKGFAVAMGSGLPETIAEVSQWASTLADKRIGLIPVSALYER